MRNQLVQPVEQFFNREPGSSSTGGEFARQFEELKMRLGMDCGFDADARC